MYVRVPLETQRVDDNFRDFVLGQIQQIDALSHSASVKLYGFSDDEPNELECSLDNLDRCLILPQSHIILHQTRQLGRVLYPCQTSWQQGRFMEYYVQIEGNREIISLSEDLFQAEANRQDYFPERQLLYYEFQNPVWKFPRDQVIESYSELQNAAFGIEELIGTRLMLLAHQADVITRVLADTTCRYILADEVGLGKTIEACVILKGLQKRHPLLRTVILAPATLVYQWHQELNNKFWIDFPLVQSEQKLAAAYAQGGCIVSVEDLFVDDKLWASIATYQWDVLIVDEAHHLCTIPILYQRVHQLSKAIERVLILSATPIQRYAHEYLSLLAIMDPYRYDPDDMTTFATLLNAQDKIRRYTTFLARTLKQKTFDAEDFLDDMEPIMKALKHDRQLKLLVEHIEEAANKHDGGLTAAKESLAYVSENYRIERRIVRNRRAYLGDLLPTRTLDTTYSYDPDEEEATALDCLYEYIEHYLKTFANYAVCIEYCRTLLSAAASSPHALLDVLETRIAYVTTSERSAPPTIRNVLLPVAPRQEALRTQILIELVPILEDEYSQFLEPLLRLVQSWWEKTNRVLEQAAQRLEPSPLTSHRLLQVFNAIHTAMTENQTNKILVFSGWDQTLEALLPILQKRYGQNVITEFTCAYTDEQLQMNADAFQSEAHCRILLCDELGGEGRNFQMADRIIHIDLPWTPAMIEQRIGRVDRIGRKGEVCSIVPFARGWGEEDLFQIWQTAFQLFTRSISGMEIALEGIQNELLSALKSNPMHGLKDILEGMIARATQLRKEVEEERYFEELATNEQLRKDFDALTEKYRDGELLRTSCLHWANLAGIRSDYYPSSNTVIFNPKHFSLGSMKKAHFLQPPNMEEALRRSGRKNSLVIRGTFQRDIAVRHEELVFFAPGNDPWLDAIIANAIEADRGRCCAIQRSIPGAKGTWRGFELLYSLSIDPRPLYALGYDPTHLFRAFGFLRTPTMRLLISEQGDRVSSTGSVGKCTRRFFQKSKGDIHLGKRDGDSHIQTFKERYPTDEWRTIVQRVLATAKQELAEELDDYMEDIAMEAQDIFDRKAAGLKAAYLWQRQHTDRPIVSAEKELEEYDAISTALVEGLRHPITRLESICYWELYGVSDK
jgi:SNF2 family DNA or RNA helicase